VYNLARTLLMAHALGGEITLPAYKPNNRSPAIVSQIVSSVRPLKAQAAAPMLVIPQCDTCYGFASSPVFFIASRARSALIGPTTTSRMMPCPSIKNVAGGPKMR
jgi:hypothetical protein